MSKKKRQPCPCGSGQDLRTCCEPFHDGAEPPDPAALVRSRFSAFALGEGAYLHRTLHPDHPLRARAEADVVRELARARQQLRYRALTIHEVEVDGDQARVLFTARVFEKGRDRSFTELSRFFRTGEGWRYLDGDLMPASELDDEALTIAAFESRVE